MARGVQRAAARNSPLKHARACCRQRQVHAELRQAGGGRMDLCGVTESVDNARVLRSGRAYAVLVPRSCELTLCWRASTCSSWLQPA